MCCSADGSISFITAKEKERVGVRHSIPRKHIFLGKSNSPKEVGSLYFLKPALRQIFRN